MLKHLFSKGSGEQACHQILTLPSLAEFSCMMPFPIQVITRCDHAAYMRSDDSSPAQHICKQRKHMLMMISLPSTPN